MKKLFRLLRNIFTPKKTCCCQNRKECANHKQGKDLVFISHIHRDGGGTTDTREKDMAFLEDDYFTMNCLSITEGTWIASGFNSYVVKLK